MGTIKELLHSAKMEVRRCRFVSRWRKANQHNKTVPENIFPSTLVEVGKATYGKLKVFYGNDGGKIQIGSFCSIAPGVTFIINDGHPLDRLSTFPFDAMFLGLCNSEGLNRGSIVVEDDVWIGANATILSGVTIGQGAVVAAGAVVSKDIPPYAICGGVPARVLKYRLSDALIGKALKFNWGG